MGFEGSLCKGAPFPSCIRCNTCKSTEVHGSPCRHAASILQKGSTVHGVTFRHTDKAWYALEYHAIESVDKLPMHPTAPVCDKLSMCRTFAPLLENDRRHGKPRIKRFSARSAHVGITASNTTSSARETGVCQFVHSEDIAAGTSTAVSSTTGPITAAAKPLSTNILDWVLCDKCHQWRIAEGKITAKAWSCGDPGTGHTSCDDPENPAARLIAQDADDYYDQVEASEWQDADQGATDDATSNDLQERPAKESADVIMHCYKVGLTRSDMERLPTKASEAPNRTNFQ